MRKVKSSLLEVAFFNMANGNKSFSLIINFSSTEYYVRKVINRYKTGQAVKGEGGLA